MHTTVTVPHTKSYPILFPASGDQQTVQVLFTSRPAPTTSNAFPPSSILCRRFSASVYDLYPISPHHPRPCFSSGTYLLIAGFFASSRNSASIIKALAMCHGLWVTV